MRFLRKTQLFQTPTHSIPTFICTTANATFPTNMPLHSSNPRSLPPQSKSPPSTIPNRNPSSTPSKASTPSSPPLPGQIKSPSSKPPSPPMSADSLQPNSPGPRASVPLMTRRTGIVLWRDSGWSTIASTSKPPFSSAGSCMSGFSPGG